MHKVKVPAIHLFLLAFVAVVFIWSVIKPASYATWALESVPALVGLIIAVATYKKFRLTTLLYENIIARRQYEIRPSIIIFF